MEPQTNLPTPESLPPPVQSGGEAVSLEPVEAPAPQEVKRPSEGANQNQGQVQQTTQAQPLQTPVQEPLQQGTTSVTSDAPALADDVDVIEKEWTDKAKAIVDNSKTDPYKQNKEMSALKADYMKKRYGKDIKLMED